MQPTFLIVVLPRKAQVEGEAAGGLAYAEGVGDPAPDGLLAVVSRDAWCAEVIGMQVERGARCHAAVSRIADGDTRYRHIVQPDIELAALPLAGCGEQPFFQQLAVRAIEEDGKAGCRELVRALAQGVVAVLGHRGAADFDPYQSVLLVVFQLPIRTILSQVAGGIAGDRGAAHCGESVAVGRIAQFGGGACLRAAVDDGRGRFASAVADRVIGIALLQVGALFRGEAVEGVVAVAEAAEQAALQAFDIAVGIVAIGACPGGDLLLSQAVILVVASRQAQAVGPGETLQGAEGQVLDLAGQGRGRGVTDLQLHLADLPGAIAGIEDAQAQRVVDLRELVGAVVGIAQAVVQIASCYGYRTQLTSEVATGIVVVTDNAAGILDGRQPAHAMVAVGFHVVVVLDVQCRVGWVLATRQAVECIVGVGGDHAARIGLADDIASGIVGVGGGAAVGADQFGQIAQTVVFVSCGDTTRILHLGQIVLRVIAKLRHPLQRVGARDQTIECVKATGGAVLLGRLAQCRVVIEVIAVAMALAACPDAAQQTPQLIVNPALLLGEAVACIAQAMGRAIAHGVVVVLDLFPEVIANCDQAASGAPSVRQPTAITSCNLYNLP